MNPARPYDFDRLINRRETSCFKWEWSKKNIDSPELLPFWVADMDFAAPPEILDALRSRVDHGIFGYTTRPESLDEALISWFERRHSWKIGKSDFVEIPGIVLFLHWYIREFTEPGETVVIQEPVYYPFRDALERNARNLAVNRLLQDDEGCWTMDFEDLETIFDKTGARTLILCSPHNPVGRVWSEDELLKLADLCQAKGVTVVSDEIHADLISQGFRHIPWLSLPSERLPRSIALISATKSFNLPSLNVAFVVTPDKDFRHQIADMLAAMGFVSSGALAYTATEAAWRGGDLWLDALLNYLGENDAMVRQMLHEKLPDLRIAPLEGTYLEWLDLGSAGFDDNETWKALLDAGVWFSKGRQFGQGGSGHLRMNIACPQTMLRRGLELTLSVLAG